MRYAIWNNKGGVGKSFVTFITACEYARQHPDRRVIIVDMCPQANVSEVVLGGNGTGATELDKLLAKTPNRQTVGGYFDERISSHMRSRVMKRTMPSRQTRSMLILIPTSI